MQGPPSQGIFACRAAALEYHRLRAIAASFEPLSELGPFASFSCGVALQVYELIVTDRYVWYSRIGFGHLASRQGGYGSIRALHSCVLATRMRLDEERVAGLALSV
jgi:hypothetical protein